MRTLTTNEQAVLDYLVKNKGWHSPTIIGEVVGGRTCSGRVRHSAWACTILKRLVAKGLIVRGEIFHEKGQYMACQEQLCKRER